MSLVALTYRTQKTTIDVITVDATVSETHSSEVEVTDHPVETGADITDHARPKPDQIQLDCIISNTPMPGANDPLTQKTQDGVVFSSRGELDTSLAAQAYNDLLDLKNHGTLIDVSSQLRRYENMVLKSLSVPVDAKTGQALRFTATLKEVTIVSNKETSVDDKGKKGTDLGKKAAPPASAAEKDKSTLKRIADTATVDGLLKKAGIR